MKIFQIAVKPRYYGVPDQNDPLPHDYEPSWDYEEDLHPPVKMMKVFQQAAQDITEI